MGVPGVGYHVLLQSTFRGPLVYGRTVRSVPFQFIIFCSLRSLRSLYGQSGPFQFRGGGALN